MKRLLYILLMVPMLVACSAETQRVYGRYVPERKDDFAWENEYAAYRMYGPALANENPSNGVDLWLKATPELIVDSFYQNDLYGNKPYHINYGKGLDCYKVGHTPGCGGVVIMVGDSMYVGGPYSSWQILKQSPTELRFCLHYDSLQVANRVLQEDIIITCRSGYRLNKAKVVIYDKNGAEDSIRIQAGAGICLHDTTDHLHIDTSRGIITYAEDALSDKAAMRMNYEYNGSTSQGRSYIAIIVPQASRMDTLAGNAVAVRDYTLGDTLTYYFGGGWSGWSDGADSLPTDESWIEVVNEFVNF